MEKTIGKLFEIEEKAKLIIDRANREKIRLHDEFEEELSRLEKNINNENMKKINDYRSEMEKELDNEILQLSKKSEKQLSDLEELYRKSQDDIVNKLFEGILNT